ncbi:MAG: hypothetical protein R3Y24_02820 [Eubacteriales bacterium]
MEFMDEEIIKMRQRNRKISLEDGVYIKGEFIEFEEVKLFDDKIAITLPKTFIDMPKKIAQIKYPSNQRPQIIKTDLLGATNFTFSLIAQHLESEQLEQVANMFENTIKKVHPANVFYDKGTEDIGKLKFSWFDFKGYAIDSQMYYLYYVTIIDGNLLHGVFSCISQELEHYKEVAFLIMRSIKDLRGEKNA